MKKLTMILAVVGLLLAAVGTASAAVATFDFETAWSGDYALGWENTLYRHGDPPVGKMMQQVTTAHGGSYGMKLIADSTPESWMWWVGVNIANINPAATEKQYDPSFSAWYYDEGTTPDNDEPTGQIFSVPSWVNPYIGGSEDWTDVQFGGRDNIEDNYYYVAAGENSPGWQDSGVARTIGWHELKMQLSSTDGYIRFYLDNNLVGQSYRDDYTDLGSVMGLYTRFAAPLSDWETKPYSIWDDVTFASSYDGSAIVPEPASLVIWGLLGAGCAGGALASRRRRRALWSDETRQNIHNIIDRGRNSI